MLRSGSGAQGCQKPALLATASEVTTETFLSSGWWSQETRTVTTRCLQAKRHQILQYVQPHQGLEARSTPSLASSGAGFPERGGPRAAPRSSVTVVHRRGGSSLGGSRSMRLDPGPIRVLALGLSTLEGACGTPGGRGPGAECKAQACPRGRPGGRGSPRNPSARHGLRPRAAAGNREGGTERPARGLHQVALLGHEALWSPCPGEAGAGRSYDRQQCLQCNTVIRGRGQGKSSLLMQGPERAPTHLH